MFAKKYTYFKSARNPGKTPNMNGISWKDCPKKAAKIRSPKNNPKTQFMRQAANSRKMKVAKVSSHWSTVSIRRYPRLV